MFQYRLFGLNVSSELALPELRSAEASSRADVTVRRGPVPAHGDPVPGLSIFGDEALLFIPHVARYSIREGCDLIVDSFAQVSDRNVRLYLLGSAFAAILHQRGLLPLHANSILIDGRAIGFMGHPGAGKSTMAAWFHDSGHGILGDDVCVVADTAEGPVAHAGIPRLRLWREALEASGREAMAYERSFDDLDKYNVPIGDGEASLAQASLSHLYLLDDSGGSGRADIERLQGSAAVEALVANTYRGGYVPMMGRTREHLQACLALARQVPVFAVQRVWGLEALARQGQALADHARSIIGTS